MFNLIEKQIIDIFNLLPLKSPSKTVQMPIEFLLIRLPHKNTNLKNK
jgi:hypothetical protein